eukprot:1158052-Pelagomonas_calceolata.AAC.5
MDRLARHSWSSDLETTKTLSKRQSLCAQWCWSVGPMLMPTLTASYSIRFSQSAYCVAPGMKLSLLGLYTSTDPPGVFLHGAAQNARLLEPCTPLLATRAAVNPLLLLDILAAVDALLLM